MGFFRVIYFYRQQWQQWQHFSRSFLLHRESPHTARICSRCELLFSAVLRPFPAGPQGRRPRARPLDPASLLKKRGTGPSDDRNLLFFQAFAVFPHQKSRTGNIPIRDKPLYDQERSSSATFRRSRNISPTRSVDFTRESGFHIYAQA